MSRQLEYNSRAPEGFCPVVDFQFVMKTSLKGFLTSKCDVGNWIFFQIRNFVKNCLKFFGLFRNFLDFFERIFLGGFFWGGFFWEEFFVHIVKVS